MWNLGSTKIPIPIQHPLNTYLVFKTIVFSLPRHGPHGRRLLL